MSNNREVRIPAEEIHMFLALQRDNGANKKCFRTVIKDAKIDLQVTETKCKIFGGEWRIHRTVNSRSVEKARKWLLKHLIDFPENAGFVDSVWRTALLQRECKVTKYFMLDIDTEELKNLKKIETLLLLNEARVLKRIKSSKGWHYITEQFDTRELCKLDYVTLLRDGYYYIKTVKGD